MGESVVSNQRTAVFVASILVAFVVGLVAVEAWLPEPVQVTEPCRSAFDNFAIDKTNDSMIAAAAACSGQEFTKAARDVLDLSATEAEDFRINACNAGRTTNAVLRPCMWTDSNSGY
jgi:hypothetical protein